MGRSARMSFWHLQFCEHHMDMTLVSVIDSTNDSEVFIVIWTAV